uniref:KIB1-4 beta-propeller domain-containing protein n=1 Tax=Oryza rufipogon TaxID=4529 RepID=A0A0E0P217_ORYRU
MEWCGGVRLPCLALEHAGGGSDKPVLFSISERKAIDGGGDIPGLTNANAWATPQGWILVRDAAAAATFLQNPRDSYDTIPLPHLPQDDLPPRRCTCLLSGKPAGGDGCVVLLVHPFSTVFWHCRVGGDGGGEWAKHEYDIGTQTVDDASLRVEKVPICAVTAAARRGAFYFNAYAAGNLGVLDLASSSAAAAPAFASLDVDAGELGDVDHAHFFLVESEGELYMVSLVYELGGAGMTDCETRVHRLSEHEQPPRRRWRRARDLGGGRAFVMAPWYFAASCDAGECGLEADCVYMFYPGEDACVKISSVRERGGEIGGEKAILSLCVPIGSTLGEQQDTMRNDATRLKLVAKELLFQFGWRKAGDVTHFHYLKKKRARRGGVRRSSTGEQSVVDSNTMFGMDPLPVPCLALQQQQHGPESVKTTLFNIFEGQDIACDIDALTNNSSKFWATPQGWILVRDNTSLSTFLFSPQNPDEKVPLPYLPEDMPRTCTCLLSDKKPTLPGCIDLLVEPNATVIWHCRVDGKEWARHEYDIGTQLFDPVSDLHEKVPICPIAACRGNESLADIGVLEFSPTPVFSSLELGGELEAADRAKVFLVGSEEELYMVSLVYGFGCDMIDGESQVHKMDFSEQRWCRADDLGGRAFLLAPGYFGASCSADDCGLEADCVYMFYPGDKACLKISNVKDGGVEFMEVPTARRALWNASPVVSVPVPCLSMEQRDEPAHKPAVFSISDKKAIIGGDIPGLTNANAWFTPQGWILLRLSTATFLQNPQDSQDKIHLPHLPDGLSTRCSCQLSGKPSLPGCIVLVVEPVATVIWHCRIVDDEWTRHEYDIGTLPFDPPIDGKDHDDVVICQIAACQGKFYFNSFFDTIGVLEFTPTPVFSSIEIVDPIPGGLGVTGAAHVYLVESEDELYMVCLRIVYEFTIYDMTIHKMDFLSRQWRRADEIGSRAFFLAPLYFGASCSVDEYGLEKDSVYVSYAVDKCFEVSKVEDDETERWLGTVAADPTN